MRLTKFFALSALITTTAFASSGPPWISIELPANPYDRATNGAPV